MEYNEDKIYPQLPTAPPGDTGHDYRLEKINKIQETLEVERDKRQMLSKKYHRGIKIVNGVDSVLVVTTMGLGIAGVGLLSTIVAAPLVIVMEGVAVGTGLLSIAGKFVNTKLFAKAEKHEKIQVLAESKLNTISDHISKAMMDGKITDEEFSLILSELEKFKQMKNEIKRTMTKNINRDLENSLIEQGRTEARASFRRMFEKKNNKM